MMDKKDKMIYEFPQGIINWYPFKNKSKVLFIYQGNSAVANLLMQKDVDLTVAAPEELRTDEFQQSFGGNFDYIIAIRVIELLEKPIDFLVSLHELSSEGGVLLLGAENRLGIRYFLGDTDPFTGCVFDGVDNYREITDGQRRHLKGRCYTKSEISRFLREGGWDRMKAYSVMPTLDAPQLIYADSFVPREELANRYFPRYNSVDTIFAREENILTDLIDNGIFHGMANALLFECALKGDFCKADQITLSMDRGHEEAMSTILYNDNRVEKRALFPEGMARLKSLADHMDELSRQNIPVIKGLLAEGAYVMPFSEGKLASIYLQELLSKDIPLFLKRMDRYRELIMRSSVKVREDEQLGAIYAHGYLDMVPINCFYVNEDFCFFDQEFVAEEYPVDAIIYRAIAAIYQGQPQLEVTYPMRNLWTRYHLTDKWKKLDEYARSFTEGLRNQSALQNFNRKSYRDDSVLRNNRWRMNYAEQEFEQMFYNPFVGIEGRKLFLFGSGRYADKFIAMYHRDYEIEGILDNNPAKWGTELNGYPVFSPEKLYELNPEEYKVIICMKDFEAVAEQLKTMGTVHVSAFENHKVYPGRQASILYKDTIKQRGIIKKYKVGYIAGVFDLFHLGHLNMFRRAKEQCEYLIVGVVTDEGVKAFKQKETYIPFEERIEVVRSCRYVDEAVEIPFIYRTTKDAFEKYHFNVQFSGSDYENNSEWVSTRKYLEENGAELVFFPYTQQTSSTRIKTLIDKGLL